MYPSFKLHFLYIGSVTYSDGSSYGGTDWTTGVCDASPYIFLRPFAFTYSKPNGYTSSTQTTCGFPSTNSIIRYVISGGGLVATALLFFKTPVSVIARQIWAALGFLYLVVFILDANDTENGITACKDGFANTNLQTDFDSKGITLSCDNSNYAGLAVIDLILCVTFFLLHSAWALTKDLYVVKK